MGGGIEGPVGKSVGGREGPVGSGIEGPVGAFHEYTCGFRPKLVSRSHSIRPRLNFSPLLILYLTSSLVHGGGSSSCRVLCSALAIVILGFSELDFSTQTLWFRNEVRSLR